MKLQWKPVAEWRDGAVWFEVLTVGEEAGRGEWRVLQFGIDGQWADVPTVKP